MSFYNAVEVFSHEMSWATLLLYSHVYFTDYNIKLDFLFWCYKRKVRQAAFVIKAWPIFMKTKVEVFYDIN